MPAKLDLIGKKFYEWEVLNETNDRKHGSVIWIAKCNQCNKIYRVTTDTIKNSKSCQSCSNVKHGHGYDTPTYKSYWSMRQRCLNENNDNYKNYGGRGIEVCDRWKDSFENFLEDMGERPEGMSIDRIDNNGNYETSNCKWSTMKEQRNNSRQNKLKEWDKYLVKSLCREGVDKKEIAKRFGISVWYVYDINRGRR